MKNKKEGLRNFVLSKSQFFILQDNEEAEIRYLSYEIIPNRFDGGKSEIVRYHLEVDGREMLWDRVSRDLASQILNLEEGCLIRIKREGEKNQTKYYVTKIYKVIVDTCGVCLYQFAGACVSGLDYHGIHSISVFVAKRAGNVYGQGGS